MNDRKQQIKQLDSLKSHITKLRWLFVSNVDEDLDEELRQDLYWNIQFFWNLIEDEVITTKITLKERLDYYAFLITATEEEEEIEIEEIEFIDPED